MLARGDWDYVMVIVSLSRFLSFLLTICASMKYPWGSKSIFNGLVEDFGDLRWDTQPPNNLLLAPSHSRSHRPRLNQILQYRDPCLEHINQEEGQLLRGQGHVYWRRCCGVEVDCGWGLRGVGGLRILLLGHSHLLLLQIAVDKLLDLLFINFDLISDINGVANQDHQRPLLKLRLKRNRPIQVTGRLIKPLLIPEQLLQTPETALVLLEARGGWGILETARGGLWSHWYFIWADIF